jgi:SSS family solute:Na+ symporter
MPFLVRSGVVFITLVILFVWISLCSKKAVPADELDEHTIKTQLFWSRVMFIVAAISLALCIGGFFNETMHMLGFEGAMIFFAAITGTIGIYLRSNALDKLQDPKLVPIDLKVFKTDRIFDFGAFGVIAILTILYIALW